MMHHRSRYRAAVAYVAAAALTVPISWAGPWAGAQAAEEETAGNNLSFPVLWAEDDYRLNVPGTMGAAVIGTEPVAGTVSPDDPTACQAAIQKSELNTWQAENESGAGRGVTSIDWGDNLEAKDWRVGQVVRVETGLYASLDDTMLRYAMCYVSGQGQTEVWGLQVEGAGANPENYSPVTIDSDEAMVYSAGGRLTIQKVTDPSSATWNAALGRWVGDGVEAPVFNGAAWERTTDGPGSFGAELNVQGKVIYGFIWRTGNLDEGEYRLTFSLDGPRSGFPGSGTSLSGATIRGEEIVTPADEGGGNQGVIVGADELTYIDVGLTQGSGSGGGGGGIVTPDGESPLFIDSTPSTALTVGTPYEYTFTASGDPAPTFSVTGELPPGLALDPSTGVLSGTPTQVGDYAVIVTASNGIEPDVDTPTLAFTVSSGSTPPPPTNPGTPPPGVLLPPGAPQGVTVMTTAREATLTWGTPTSPGSTSIDGYRADISPGNEVCEVGETQNRCTFSGLTEGETYRFRVQARNSIGYGPYAETTATISASADDSASIMIVAQRNRSRVQVKGMTEGIPVATQLQTRLNLGEGEQTGSRGPAVQDDSGFTWQRRLGEGRQLQLRFAYGDVMSNMVDLTPGESNASIVVTGTRDRIRSRDRIRIDGVTDGLPEQVRLRSRFDLGDGYQAGRNSPMINESGEFTWQRRVGVRNSIRVRFEYGPITSNQVVFSPRS